MGLGGEDSSQDVTDVKEVGSEVLPTPQYLLHGMDHSTPYPDIQG